VVHYSDQASPGAEKIYTSSPSTFAGTPASRSQAAQQAPSSPSGGGLGYSELSITSPTDSQTYFGDDVVAVHLNLAPPLKMNQSVTWHLNGRQLDSPADAVSFSLPHLDRGTYVLAATVTDQNGDSQSSNSVTFFVRQPSALSPQHK
jgi:hypothetical protein